MNGSVTNKRTASSAAGQNGRHGRREIVDRVTETQRMVDEAAKRFWAKRGMPVPQNNWHHISMPHLTGDSIDLHIRK